MYLDPGIGRMIIQAIVAFIAMAGGLFIIFKNRLVNWVKKKRGIPIDLVAADENNENAEPGETADIVKTDENSPSKDETQASNENRG